MTSTIRRPLKPKTPWNLPPANGAYQLPDLLHLPDLLQCTYPNHAFLSVDTETTGEHFHKPIAPGLAPARPWLITAHSYDPRTRSLSPHLFRAKVNPRTREVSWPSRELIRFRSLLKRYEHYRSRPYVFHNSLFDLPALRSINIDIPPELCEDTLPASHVLDSSEPHGLKDLAIRYCDILDTDEIVLKAKTQQAIELAKQHGFPIHPAWKANIYLIDHFFQTSEAELYATGDTRRTALLWLLQESILHKPKRTPCATGPDWPHYHREQRIACVTDRMCRNPIYIRPESDALLQSHRTLCDQHDTHTQTLAGLSGNVRSPLWLRKVLYSPDCLALPVIALTEKAREPSTAADTLLQLSLFSEVHDRPEASEFIQSLLQYRAYAYAVSIGEGYKERAVLHNGIEWLYGHFNPWATITTRFSASDPNLQSVKKDAEDGISTRAYFGPPPGWWWISFDFNQLELRLMARASGDPTLLSVLEGGLDQHQHTADAINRIRQSLGLSPVPRSVGKAVNFAWQYGARPRKLAAMSGIPVDQADALDNAMRTAYPGVMAFMDRTSAIVRKHGLVRTLFGYPLHVRPTLNPYTGNLEPVDYVGTNYVIQGTAGDICKNTMIAMHEYLEHHNLTGRAHLLLTIHDEIILEVKRGFARKHIHALSRIATSAGLPINCPTPAKVSLITDHWGNPQPL